MKALTIWQPWASLVIAGAKPYEFRTWDYRERYPGLVNERIVIHASVRPIRPPEVMELLVRIAKRDGTLRNDIALPLLERVMHAHKCQGVLELGAALGTAIIGKPRKIAGNFALPASNKTVNSMWAWPLSEPSPFEPPIPVNGKQGFWDWPYRIGVAA